jgi:hypothetical protein
MLGGPKSCCSLAGRNLLGAFAFVRKKYFHELIKHPKKIP